MKKHPSIIAALAIVVTIFFLIRFNSSTLTSDGAIDHPTAIRLTDSREQESAKQKSKESFINDSLENVKKLMPSELSAMKGVGSLPQTEQASLWNALSEAQRSIRPLSDHQRTMPENEGADYLASNPSQKLRARFLPDGMRLLSSYPNRDWEGVISLDTDALAEIRQEGTQLEYARPGIVEWYHNNHDGIEHGFIVEKPTAGSAVGQLVIPVQVSGLSAEPLEGRVAESSDLQFVNEVGEPVLSYTDLKVWDANGAILLASMQPTTGGLEICVADAGASYPITIDPLIASLEQRLGPEVTGTGAEGDVFGSSVSVSGDTVAIGAPGDDVDIYSSGSVYLFIRSLNVWSLEQIVTASDASSFDSFGYSVSLSSNTLVVGARYQDTNGNNSGSAYVYKRNSGVWTEQQQLTAADGAAGDQFGHSVSISGNTLAVGAPYVDEVDALEEVVSNAGSVYVFTYNGVTWEQEQKLSGDLESDNFGYSVSVDGDFLLTGAMRDSDISTVAGSAYVFIRNTGVWIEEQKLFASDADVNSKFGWSVSLSGSTALIGARDDDGAATSSGSAYIYVRSAGTWTEEQKLSAPDADIYRSFGHSVSLSGDTAVIGSPFNGPACYVFSRNLGVWSLASQFSGVGRFGWVVSIDGDTIVVGANDAGKYRSDSGAAFVYYETSLSWGLQQELDVGYSAAGDYFGLAVAIDGNRALVGVNGDSDNGLFAGSVYDFVRTGNVWNQNAKISASDGANGDNFGSSVSLSGNVAVIGASGDIYDSGSAYVFTALGGASSNFSETQKLVQPNASVGDFFGFSVSVSGGYAIIGAYGDDDDGVNSGSAFLFKFNESTELWEFDQRFGGGFPQANDNFGYSVCISGDSLIIGAPNASANDLNSGDASVFVNYGSGSWWEVFLSSAAANGDRFGHSVCIDGDVAIVGACEDDVTGVDQGSAYIYVRPEGQGWSQAYLQKLTANDGSAGDYFGYSVGISDSTAIVGAYRDSDIASQAGSAYIFTDGASWTQLQKLNSSESGDISQRFGAAVSISGDTMLVGCPLDDSVDLLGGLAPEQGSAFIFRLEDIQPSPDIEISRGISTVLDGASVMLDDTAIGTSRVYTYTISNVGDAGLSGLSLLKDGLNSADYSLGSLSTTSLAVGESTVFRVTFTPSSVGIRSAAIHINSNDSDENPFDITLSGNGLANTDTDPGSDAWEIANGFDPALDGDVSSLDSDNDGDLDIIEIFQGTDRNGAGESYGFKELGATTGVQELSAQFRRSTTQNVVEAVSQWSCDLVNWHYSGETAGGITVVIGETVVGGGAGYEIVEAVTEVTAGSSDCLFYRLEFLPIE